MTHMLPLFPVPISFIEATLSAHWDSELRQDDLILYDDDILIRLMHIRLMYGRLFQRYHLYRRRFWSRMEPHEQVLAEANAEYAEDIYGTLVAMEKARILELEQFDSDLAATMELDAKAWHRKFVEARAQIRHESQLPTNTRAFNSTAPVIDRLRLEFGVIHQLLPRYSKIALDEIIELMQLSQHETSRTNLAPNADRHQARYRIGREVLSPIEHGIALAYDRLNQELINCCNNANQLQGAAGRNRFLITNQDIPLPTIQTIEAWAVCCLHHLIPLGSNQFLATFTPPFLPVTKDHRAGGQGIVEDGTASHSLPGRSSGHERNEHGSILPGQARVQTVWFDLNQSDSVRLVTGEFGLDMERVRQDFRHQLSLWPNLPHGVNGIESLWGLTQQHRELLNVISSPLQDPWINGSAMLSPAWLATTHMPISTPWRFYSNSYNIHFRFDSNIHGDEAISEWSAQFVATLIQRLRLTQHGAFMNQFETALSLDAWRPNKQATVKHKDSKVRFDFSGLKATPKSE